MSAVALLEKNPSPTPEQAKAALDGNICRCGTYPRVLEAVLEHAKGVRVAENPQVPEVSAPARPQQHEKYPWPAETHR